ncbi:MAG: pilus assembly protein TadG-related protein [Candidatus Dormibacteria bacterium]
MKTPGPTCGGRQRGQILPIFGLILVLLLLPVTGLAVDGGLLLSTHASLVGSVQGAAEAAAQAVDVTALQDQDVFQLCATPDGGADCGNGVGTVGAVVRQVMTVGNPDMPQVCTDVGTAPLPRRPTSAAGCAFDVVLRCAAATGSGVGIPEGVRVLAWRTVRLPLLVFPGWASSRLSSTATAWMEHGFGPQSDQLLGARPC